MRIRFFIIAFFLAGIASIQAENWKEELKFSSFSSISLAQLKEGNIETSRTSVETPKTAIAVETLCYVAKSPEQVAKTLMSWSPTAHGDLGILAHKSLSAPAKEDDFSSLKLDAEQDEQQWLLDQSESAGSTSNILNVGKKDFTKLAKAGDKPAALTSAWRSILYARASAYQSGGLEDLESYQTEDGVFVHKKEWKKLFGSLPKINSHFKDLIKKIQETDPAETPEGVLPSVYYLEKIKINNQLALVLGATKSVKTSNGWQIADFQYYVCSNYYSSLVLYQIVPSGNGSLIWRGDYVLSPEMASLKGVERLFSENILLKEVKKTLEYFKEDLK
ncbi:MAG: hypothetical protein ACOY3I_02925 [Verrucomicrobiota bacterium]